MDHTGTHSGSKVFTYGYDKLNRLLSATTAANDLNETLAYDLMGNIQNPLPQALVDSRGDRHATLAMTVDEEELKSQASSRGHTRS